MDGVRCVFISCTLQILVFCEMAGAVSAVVESQHFCLLLPLKIVVHTDKPQVLAFAVFQFVSARTLADSAD